MTAFEPATDMVVFGGDTVFAADFNAMLKTLPRTYYKASATSRNTTVTYTDDPELLSIPLEVGSYEIELIGFWTQATTTTQKIKTMWKFTGTWNSPIRNCMGAAAAQTGAPNAVTDVTMSGFVADTQDAVYNTSISSSYSVFREIVLNAVVTVAGNLSLQWAQSVSSGNNTNLQLGTGFRIRKLTD